MLISALMLPLFSLVLVALLVAGIFGFLSPLPLSSVLPVLILIGLNRRKWKLLLPFLLLSLILIYSLLFFSNFFLSLTVSSFVLSRDSVFTASPVPSRVSVPSLPARIGFYEPYAGSCRVGCMFISFTLIFRPARSYGCLWAFPQFIKKLLDTFSSLCYFFLTRRSFESSQNSFRELRKDFLLPFEKGEVRL